MTVLEKGTVVDGRYELLGKLGEGGFGLVYKAKHVQFDRIVALKILNTDLLLESDGLARFEREAKAMAALKHRNIVSLYAYGTHDGAPYMVLEYIEGQSLDRLLMGGNRLTLPQAASILSQVCEGMECAHANGVVHRDLKPSNVMIVEGPDGKDVVKLIDFGLARLLPGYGMSAQKLTEAGCALGTCFYMAPEQCTGEEVDHQADIYSAGCIFFQCLEGHPPYTAEDNVAVMYQQLNAAVPQCSYPSAQPVIDKAMAKELRDRYGTAEEMRADLQLLASSTTALSAIPKSPPTARRPSPFISKQILFVVLAGTAVLLVVAGLLIGGRQKNTTTSTATLGTSSTELYARLDPLTIIATDQYGKLVNEVYAQNQKDHLLDRHKERKLYYRLATYSLLSHQYEKAQLYLDKGVELSKRISERDPDGWQFDLKQAWVWINRGRKQDGVALLKKLRDQHEELGYCHDSAGFAGMDLQQFYCDEGEYDKAIAEIDETLKQGPFSSSVMRELQNSRGRIRAIKHDYARGLADSEAANVYQDSNPRFMHHTTMNIVRCALATQHYKRALELAPQLHDGTGLEDTLNNYLLLLATAARNGDRAGVAEWGTKLLKEHFTSAEHLEITKGDWEICASALRDGGYDDLLAQLVKTYRPKNET